MLRVLWLCLVCLPAAAFAQEAPAPAPSSAIVPFILQYVVVPALGVLSPMAVALAFKGIGLLIAKVGNEKLRGIMVRIEEAVRVAVLHVEQTMRPKLASALADGVITPVEARELRDAALAAVKAELGPVLGQLGPVFGLASEAAIDAFLTRRIEAAVASMPATNPSPP